MENTAVTPDIFPFTAWEQAVFVVLFIVFVIGLLRWFSNQQQEWQDFINEQNDRWQIAVKDQNTQWAVAVKDQNIQWAVTVKDQNIQWQNWLKEQNDRECVTMDKVTVSLERLTLEIAKHDERSAGRFMEALEVARKMNEESKPTPRKKQGNIS